MAYLRPIPWVHVSIRPLWWAVGVGAVCNALVLMSCKTRESNSPTAAGNESAVSSSGSTPTDDDTEEPPKRVIIQNASEDTDRWLFVDRLMDGAKGGWATGSFDAKRNRLSIETRDLRGFALDTDKIAIDWSRPVVLQLNGRTSELRRREFTRLHFALDGHGQWVVVEP